MQALVAKGLVQVQPGPDDERVKRARLTAAGLAEYEEMERRSDGWAASMLEPLTEAQRERLVAAMDEVHRLLQASRTRIERVDPASAAARWCIAQYFAELARRFETGFDPAASLPVDAAELTPPRGVQLVASVDTAWVACGSIKTVAPGVGYIKRMWVSDAARGLGLGRRMLAALEAEARTLGMHTVRLETNRALAEAIALYRSAGYTEVPPFNAEPYAHHWFEKALA